MHLTSRSSTFHRLLLLASQRIPGPKLGRSRLCTLPVRVFWLFGSILHVGGLVLLRQVLGQLV